jgi:hypothetical protein
MSSYPHLLSPLRVAGVTLPNRMVMGAMHTRLETLDRPHERLAAFYAARAAGEIGMILTGGYSPVPEGVIDEGGLVLNSPDQLGEHRLITSEVRKAGGAGTEFAWMLGTHDARCETKLAANAPEFEGIRGFHLKDHFPHWRPCWTFWINGSTCVTHFYHTGLHDGHNNLLKGQCHYVTGHTHSLKTTPWTNASGETIWAVNTGTLADSLGPHNVDYQQGRHGNHRSGFAVLTYRDGQLLMPELAIGGMGSGSSSTWSGLSAPAACHSPSFGIVTVTCGLNCRLR